MTRRNNGPQFLDSVLFAYGATLTSLIIYISGRNLEDPNNLVLLILFLPTSYYFLTRLSMKIRSNFQSFLNLGKADNDYDHFSFSAFFNQTDTSFLINLFLVCFAIATVLFRISIYIAAQ